MNSINKTLYIPLYGKSFVSKRGIFLKDKKAEEIWAAEGFALKGKSKSKWLAFYMGIRAAVFDEWLNAQLAAAPEAVVLHIGCGMDSRVLRTGADYQKWYDIDFPEVIEERRQYFAESASYQMIAGDVRQSDWLTDLAETKRAVIVMEGVSMYLTTGELQEFTATLCAHFEDISLLMDSYTVLAAKLSKYKNPINDVGVSKVYGIDHPGLLQQGRLMYRQELTMTPQKYIDELSGIEKLVFKRLYAGHFSQKLYRLYEFRTV